MYQRPFESIRPNLLPYRSTHKLMKSKILCLHKIFSAQKVGGNFLSAWVVPMNFLLAVHFLARPCENFSHADPTVYVRPSLLRFYPFFQNRAKPEKYLLRFRSKNCVKKVSIWRLLCNPTSLFSQWLFLVISLDSLCALLYQNGCFRLKSLIETP